VGLDRGCIKGGREETETRGQRVHRILPSLCFDQSLSTSLSPLGFFCHRHQGSEWYDRSSLGGTTRRSV